MSYHPVATVLTSKFMETTTELSRDGGKGAVKTGRQTLSFSAFTLSLEPNNVKFTQDTFPARTTWLMGHPEEYTCPPHFLCPTYPSPQSCMASLQISTQNSPLQALPSTFRQMPYPSPNMCFPMTNVPQSMQRLIAGEKSFPLAPFIARKEHHPWNAQLLTSPPRKRPRPVPYCKNLSPLPSPLCPHCPAGQRLCL